MRGPLFNQVIRTRALSAQSVRDLETMYSLILAARGITEDSIEERDERIALTALCWITWPGKPPEYKQEIRPFLESFRGIADDPRQQEEFRGLLRPALVTAHDVHKVSFSRLARVFGRREATGGTLMELLTEELRDLYDAEGQLTAASPKLVRVATTKELKQLLTEHTAVTKNQVHRMETVFEILGERAKGKPCKAMRGLLGETQEIIQEHTRGDLLDSAIISSCQKIKHYEIAGYGTAHMLAKTLREREVGELIKETLMEEKAIDRNLTQIAREIQNEMRHTREGLSKTGLGKRSGRRSRR